MKKWKIFLCVSISALILINGVFIYIENVYIKSDDKIVVNEIKEEESMNTEEVEATLEEGASSIQASDDGEYIAYSKDGKIKIIDTKDNNIINYNKVTDGEIIYFKWVSGEKNLFVIEKIQEDGEFFLKPITFKVKNKEAVELIDFDTNEIKLLINNDESVENIVFATGCNYIYIQLKNSEGKSDLYTINVMNQAKKVQEDIYIDNMVVPFEKPKLIIENNSKIMLLDSKEYIDIQGVSEYRILGTDKNDKIYIGNEKEGMITEINSSIIDNNNSFSWEKIILDEPLSKEDIKVDYSGKIYLIYKDKGLIKEATTGLSTQYKGDIVQSYSNGIIYIEDSNIKKILMK